MYCTRNVTESIIWVGGCDRRLALFENLFPISRGVAYNSYVILDEKTALIDTVDSSISRQFLENIHHALNGRSLDYLVINHMEPDHCANIEELMLRFPNLHIVGNEKTLTLIRQFYDMDVEGRILTVKENDILSLGRHTLRFYFTPMVHWPEVMMSYEENEKILFSADGFGSFGALNGALFSDEVDFDRDWLRDARRYYGNIVGKYDRWSRYEPEEKTVALFYGSMYGDTENAVNILAAGLAEHGIRNIAVYDMSSTHVSELIAEVLRCSHLVLASPTYNNGIYPAMLNFLHDMKALNLQNRTVALIENGSWAPSSAKQIQALLEDMKKIRILEPVVSIRSSVKQDAMHSLSEQYGV